MCVCVSQYNNCTERRSWLRREHVYAHRDVAVRTRRRGAVCACEHHMGQQSRAACIGAATDCPGAQRRRANTKVTAPCMAISALKLKSTPLKLKREIEIEIRHPGFEIPLAGIKQEQRLDHISHYQPAGKEWRRKKQGSAEQLHHRPSEVGACAALYTREA